jgi:hypothetical protein
MPWTTPKTWSVAEVVTAANMNAQLRDNLSLVPHFVVKAADETVTSSTTLQDDDHLLFAMGANESWQFHGNLWTSNAAEIGHIKITFTVPASGSYMATAYGPATGGTWQFSNIRSVSDVPSFFSASTGIQISVFGIARTAGTAGNCTLQWAQATSNGTGTILKKDSHLFVSKLQ